MRTVAFVAITFTALSVTGGAARADGDWCAYDVRGGTNCGFHSYAQCHTYIWGIGGYCAYNPQFAGRRGRRYWD